MSKEEMKKDKRIKREVKRLANIYQKLSSNEMQTIDGLIKRAAYMRVTLEDMEADLDANGFVEMFSQSPDVSPYERERPTARLYNTMNKNYQTIVKQLADFVVKEELPPEAQKDELDRFLEDE